MGREKSYTCSIPCRTTPSHQVKPGQKSPAHNREGATRLGGDDEIAGEGGILLGPGRSLGDRRQQRTPIKVLRHSPPPTEKGAAFSPPPPLQIPQDCSSRRFGEHAPPSHKLTRPTPALSTTPATPRADPDRLVLQAADARGGAAVATTQKPRPSSPPPPSARASCHVAQGRGARHCGSRPREGPYQRPPPRHPC